MCLSHLFTIDRILKLEYISHFFFFCNRLICTKVCKKEHKCFSIFYREIEGEVEKQQRTASLSRKFREELLQFLIFMSCFNKQDCVGQS